MSNELQISRAVLVSMIDSYHNGNEVKTNEVVSDSIFYHPFHKIVFNTLKMYESAGYVIDQTTIEYKLFELENKYDSFRDEWIHIMCAQAGGVDFVKTYVKMLRKIHEQKLSMMV